MDFDVTMLTDSMDDAEIDDVLDLAIGLLSHGVAFDLRHEASIIERS